MRIFRDFCEVTNYLIMDTTNLKQLKSGILSICMVMMSVGSLWAQDDISVTGKVVDEDGLPLEGSL